MTDNLANTPDILSPSGAPDQPSIPGELWIVIKRLPAYARLVSAMARDPEVPPASKAFLIAGGAYLVSPIDLVPGIIPVAGQLDDLYVVLIGLQQAVKRCPPAVVTKHFAAAGLDPASIDDDLAAVRSFVRRGVAWTIDRGGRAATALGRQVKTIATRARARKETTL